MIRENDIIMMSPDLVEKSSTASSRACDEELRQLAPPKLRAVMRSGSGCGCGCGARKRLLKQLSLCEPRDAAWERRRRLMLLRRNDAGCGCGDEDGGDCGGTGEAGDDMQGLTDEDLSELKGSIELGFGFNEEDGQALCETLPALDLYFAVNRQFSPSPVSTPKSRASTSSSSSSSSSLSIGRSSPMGSPRCDSESWRICSPGDDPQQVKTKIRHWAQAVACSVIQSYELINQ